MKWQDLGYEQCTWEMEKDIAKFSKEIEDFHTREKQLEDGRRGAKPKRDNVLQYLGQPPFLSSAAGLLHPYQVCVCVCVCVCVRVHFTLN